MIGCVLLAGLIFAQGVQPVAPGQMPGPGGHGRSGWLAQNPPQAASLEGKLVFLNGKPGLQAKDGTFIFVMPRFYYYAYTDGIKEGAAIKADGFLLASLPGQDNQVFVATKAVIGGKTYDFTTRPFRGMGGFIGRGHGFDRNRGGMGWGGFGGLLPGGSGK
jgi:hypothetical protein